jgi:hypothetical protein
MLMGMLWPVTFLLSMLLQAASPPSALDNVLNPEEKARIERETKIDGRIKVYESASTRIQKTLQTAVSEEEFQAVPDSLKLWTALLSGSLQDIEANLKTKKKSRALINYEIQVRKAISNTQSYKLKAPVEQQETFDSCISQAESVRKRFVEILFQR